MRKIFVKPPVLAMTLLVFGTGLAEAQTTINPPPIPGPFQVAMTPARPQPSAPIRVGQQVPYWMQSATPPAIGQLLGATRQPGQLVYAGQATGQSQPPVYQFFPGRGWMLVEQNPQGQARANTNPAFGQMTAPGYFPGYRPFAGQQGTATAPQTTAPQAYGQQGYPPAGWNQGYAPGYGQGYGQNYGQNYGQWQGYVPFNNMGFWPGNQPGFQPGYQPNYQQGYRAQARPQN